MHRRSPGRQAGRYNEEKDKRSNRKPNRKTNADAIEDAKDVAAAIADNIGILAVGNSRVSVDNSNPSVGNDPAESNHAKVKENRPVPPPTWFQKMQGMTPSRSYSKKKDEDK